MSAGLEVLTLGGAMKSRLTGLKGVVRGLPHRLLGGIARGTYSVSFFLRVTHD
jgi:hypothetical protein